MDRGKRLPHLPKKYATELMLECEHVENLQFRQGEAPAEEGISEASPEEVDKETGLLS